MPEPRPSRVVGGGVFALVFGLVACELSPAGLLSTALLPGADASIEDASSSDASRDSTHAIDSSPEDAGLDGEALDAPPDGDFADAEPSDAESSDGAPFGDAGEACGLGGRCARIPQGWSVVSYVQGSSICPVGWTKRGDVAEGVSSPANCDCACGAPNGNPCVHATFDVEWRTGMMACNDGVNALLGDGGCNPFTFSTSDGFAPNGGSIKAVRDRRPLPCPGTSSVPPATFGDDSSAVCEPSGLAQGSCRGPQRCLVQPAGGRLCFFRDGEENCPGSGLTRYVVGDVAGRLTDNRTCGACTCRSSSQVCSPYELEVTDDATCATNLVDVPVACGPLNPSAGLPTTFTHFRVVSNPSSQSCIPDTVSPVSGTVRFQTPKTLCCAP